MGIANQMKYAFCLNAGTREVLMGKVCLMQLIFLAFVMALGEFVAIIYKKLHKFGSKVLVMVSSSVIVAIIASFMFRNT